MTKVSGISSPPAPSLRYTKSGNVDLHHVTDAATGWDWTETAEATGFSLPLGRRASRSAHLFFQLVARRYERGSLLITTNQLVTQWGAVFGDEVLAAAILDRLLHHRQTLMIQGDSYRLKQKRKAGLIPAMPHPQGALAGEPARADRRNDD
jgi:protocatechuate 3,4-dioxygenase beta subunit